MLFLERFTKTTGKSGGKGSQGGELFMIHFGGLFLACLVFVLIAIYFFGFLFTNIWYVIIFVAFVLAVIASAYLKREEKKRDLEKRVEQLERQMSEKQEKPE